MEPITLAEHVGPLLEALNGAWAVLATAVTALFLAYLWREGRASGFDLRSWWRGNMPLNMQLAVAIVVVHAGNACVRGVLWFWRWSGQSGPMVMPSGLLVGMLGFYVIAIVGELCIMRVVSRTWLGSWPWLVALMGAILFAAIFSG